MVVLVYLGVRMREGMTTSVGAQLIDLLADYYAKKETNAAATPPIDNTKNAKTTVEGILKLNITENNYNYILNMTELNDESKINVIKKSLTDSLSRNNTQPSMTINTYRSILSILEDSAIKPEQKVSDVKQIVYDKSQDPRFSYVFDGSTTYASDVERVKAIETAAYNTLN